MSKVQNTKLKRIWNIVSNILLYLFVGLCLLVVIFTVSSKKDEDGTATFFGKQMKIVISDSMDKCDETDVSQFEIKSIPIKSIIIIDTVPTNKNEANKWYSELKVGDVLTFKYYYTEQVTITHRITKITAKDTGGYLIELAGDNKNADADVLYQVIDTSDENSFNYVIGKVVGKSHFIGVALSVIKSPAGMVLIIIVPCLVIMTMEIIKIFDVLNKDKKEKQKEEQDKKDQELEELRRRLAALEAKNKEEEGK